jgi:hypothetical protein
VANQHGIFEIVHSTEDNRCIRKQLPVMGEQEVKGMIIRGDNEIKSAIPEFIPV